MTVTAYDTRTLLEVIETFDRPRTFILDTFFPQLVTFETESVELDKLPGGMKLAPFVSPFAAGRPVRTKAYQTESFKPAYIKPKDVVKPTTAQRRRPGESFMGDMSMQERMDAALTEIGLTHRRSILSRKEWMAVQALDGGAVTISGEDYPAVTVSFGRANALTVGLSGGARWGESGVVPSDNLESWFETFQTESGTPVTDVILDPGAWGFLKKDTQFLSRLDNRRQASGSMELMGVNYLDPVSDARWLGEAGGVNYWLYQWTYEADDGTVARMVPANTVYLASRQMQGMQLHGAILDVEILQALEMAPKNWVTPDPSAMHYMTQSAPLVAPGRPNASMRIRVR